MTRIPRTMGCRAEPLNRTIDRAYVIAWKLDFVAALMSLPVEVLTWAEGTVMPWLAQHPNATPAELAASSLTDTARRYLEMYPEAWARYFEIRRQGKP